MKNLVKMVFMKPKIVNLITVLSFKHLTHYLDVAALLKKGLKSSLSHLQFVIRNS